jgi:hypothetical protein
MRGGLKFVNDEKERNGHFVKGSQTNNKSFGNEYVCQEIGTYVPMYVGSLARKLKFKSFENTSTNSKGTKIFFITSFAQQVSALKLTQLRC